jgi:branched-chain amino acid aminotransferase
MQVDIRGERSTDPGRSSQPAASGPGPTDVRADVKSDAAHASAEVRTSKTPGAPAAAAPSSLAIDYRLAAERRACPAGKLGFGKVFSDHVLLADWGGPAGQRWHDARIVPWTQLRLEPSAAVLHYAQSIFEGLKAFRGVDGKLRVFRPDRHAARFVRSAERLCMPALPPEHFVQAVDALVRTEAAWVPSAPGASMYIRPTMVATEGFLGVRPAQTYAFFILVGPVDAYYAEGFAPVRIWVEREQCRVAPGGMGAAKTGGNYAASLFAAERAKQRGYAQVLWTDAKEHRYVEEVGTMNFFAVIGDEVVTPPLDGNILPGVTRDSVIALLRHQGVRVVERPLAIDELRQAQARGALREVFGTGTAAVVSPVGVLGFDDGDLQIADGKPGALCVRLHDEIQAIQRGLAPDPFGWVHEVA